VIIGRYAALTGAWSALKILPCTSAYERPVMANSPVSPEI